MRVLAFCLVILAGVGAAAASAAPSVATSSEPAVLGAWHFAERDVTVALYRSAGGLVQGKITASPRPAEVGAWLVRDARWSAKDQRYTGRLVTDETGVADVVIDVVAAAEADGTATLRLVCSRLFLTKTLTWTRPKKESP